MNTILLVEDDLRLQSVVQRGLQAEGFQVDVAADGATAFQLLQRQPYGLIILDRMLPGIDGMDICRRVHAEHLGVLVLMLTAKGDVQDRIDGLRSGADDYLTKPFAFDELVARVEALLRRGQRSESEPRSGAIQVGELRIDRGQGAVWRGDRKIVLTRKEFALLEFIARKNGEVATREELLSSVWGLQFDPGTKLVEVHIRYLRRKIDDGEAVQLIRTVRGFGYRLGEDD